MRQYGLIGFPLGHSFSKAYFEEKFCREGIAESRFDNFALESIDELPAMVCENPDLAGFNVTIPYKQEIFKYLDDIDPEAATIGAVNCVKVTRNGGGARLKGFNTDAAGFRESLLEMIGDNRPKALVLGTGGASKAVAYVLKSLGIEFSFVSRSKSSGGMTYGELTGDIVRAHKLIVNTTPLGTYPNIEACPDIPYGALTGEHLLLDLVYNPSETLFMKNGRYCGATVKNGLRMLVGQAEAAYRIFTE